MTTDFMYLINRRKTLTLNDRTVFECGSLYIMFACRRTLNGADCFKASFFDVQKLTFWFLSPARHTMDSTFHRCYLTALLKYKFSTTTASLILILVYYYISYAIFSCLMCFPNSSDDSTPVIRIHTYLRLLLQT